MLLKLKIIAREIQLDSTILIMIKINLETLYFDIFSKNSLPKYN